MDLSNADALQQSLNELKLRIGHETDEVIEQATPTPPPEPRLSETLDPAEDLALVNRLWILKAGFQETSSLVELEDVEAAIQSLVRLESKIEDFNVAFPHTLLGVDITRQATDIREKLRGFVAQRWESMVQIAGNRICFRSDEKGDSIAALYPRKDAAIASIGVLLDQLLDLEVSKVEQNDGITLIAGHQTSLDDFISSVKTITTYLATAPPPGLAQTIARRYKTHLSSGIIHRSLPRLYPSDLSALPKFKEQLQRLVELESELSEYKWLQGAEISQYVASFDEQWPTIRRGQFLARLRRLYKESAPLDSIEARRNLVRPPKDAPVDEWEWNEDEDDAAEDDATGVGAVVELWKEYASELGADHSQQFFTMYRAIVPTVYGSHSLWLYADTLAFVQHAGDAAQEALAPFAHLYLHNYVRNQAATLETDLLPQLFGNKQNKALNQLKTYIGTVAEESNAEGGPELRETVLGQLVEQIAVYVVSSVEALGDIGYEESSKLASVIAKLENLGVFFRDVKLAVPSWYKLEMLGRILMGNLATIQEMFSQHLLADFSAAELDGLLKALFVESGARQALIHDIYEAERR